MIKETTWYDSLQYCSLLLFAAAIPVGWHMALWASALVALTSLVSAVAGAIAHRRPRLLTGHAGTVALGLIVVYWLELLVSMLYTSDTATGWQVLGLKAVLLILPLALLLTAGQGLGADRLRHIGYAFLAGMAGTFVYWCVVAVGKMLAGSSFGTAFGVGFDPRHHAYTALYIAAALAFIYNELHSRWTTMPRWLRATLLALVPLFIFYTVVVNSRAGMLTLYLLEAACTVHFALTRRRWWQAVLMAVLLAGFTVGIEHAMPGHATRVADTIEDIASDEPSDARVQINGSSIEAAMKHPVFGYGVGDYHKCQVQQYNDDDFSAGISAGYNAHNQYVETVLAVGFVGLLPFLLMLVWPLWTAWRSRSDRLWLVLLLTFIVCFNMLFESMLERQMGLLFIGPVYTVMALIVSTDKNKFGQLQEK